MKISDFDIIYISYDEPNSEFNWNDLQTKFPKAKRIHGIKGFDAAHKAAASLSSTDHFFVVDGDNIVFPDFFEQEFELDNPNYVYSWSAKNNINDLIYGNGGIKLWPKHTMLNVNTHENGDGIDFCWTVPYYQMNDFYSVSCCNYSEKQAFRSGFREGLKMCLIDGKHRPSAIQDIWIGNLRRLLTWMSVGTDMPNGWWGIFGARVGCSKLLLTDFEISLINNYDWFETQWSTVYQKMNYDDCINLGKQLKIQTGLDIVDIDPDISKFIKSIQLQPSRRGLMIPHLAEEEYLIKNKLWK